jgi:LPXTG-site transpeptidase (sortase) family protein
LDANPHSPHEAPHPIITRLARLALIALLAVTTYGSVPVSAAGPAASFFVEATGHILADPFLRYWVENDGDRVLGLPVTDIVELDGRTAQYFQYGALVHKSNGEMTRLRSGADLLTALQSDPILVGGRRAPSARTVQGITLDAQAQSTNQTGSQPALAINAELLPYWQQWGGSGLLGKPISVAYRQGDLWTQWFEFGRIDLGPGGASLAEIGLELAQELDIATGPGDRGSLPLFDPSRFVNFAGDGTVPNANQPFDPVRLKIPKIKVDAAIEITNVQDGVMMNPADPWKAGWYQSFSRPGEWTNTVIAGHRDWWGYGPVVFWDLGWLQPGDKIFLVGADGSGATYVVGAVEVVPRTVDPQTIINDVGYEALTLITCGGAWNGTEYADRIIIRAYRI